MNEHPLLAQLAQIAGAFINTNNNNDEAVQAFQNTIATALLQQQDPLHIKEVFRFETLESYATQHLSPAALTTLNNVLQNITTENAGEQIRVFQREVPFKSSQIKSSVASWARGAKIDKTIGPIKNILGQDTWLDIYKTVDGAKIYLQGAAQPSAILTLHYAKIVVINPGKHYSIPACSVWLQASLISASAPTNEYCGLKVSGGSVDFSNSVFVNEDNTLVIPPGTTATITLNLVQQTDASISPDDTGIDAKEATITLPATLSITFNAPTGTITEAGTSSCKVYGQSLDFNFIQDGAPVYNALINRVAIPYKCNVETFNTNASKSKVCNIKGSAKITLSWWTLSCATIDINHVPEANGAGAIMFTTDKGLSASWMGLKDLNLAQKEWILLNTPYFLLEPGRIAITDLEAVNTGARQKYNLWKGKKEQWNFLELRFSPKLPFFYNCTQAGNETAVTLTNCLGNIDKPVNAAGKPFPLKSLQTIFMLSYSQLNQTVLLYDDNLLADELQLQALKVPAFNTVVQLPATVKSHAIALNNALLTVTSPSGLLLYGDLKDEQEFDKAVLIYSFGLLGYLPSLPDPYAGNLDIFKRSVTRSTYTIPGTNNIGVNKLLVCSMMWANDEVPVVSFVFGDLPGTTNNNTNANTNQPETIQLNLHNNASLALQENAAAAERSRNYLKAQTNAVAGASDLEPLMVNNNTITAFSRGLNRYDFFNLLDVSTAADLLGVSVGFMNEEFIFKETFKVEPVNTNANPIAIKGMDVVATGRFVRIYTVPQISWEPLLNITAPFNVSNDPPYGLLKFNNDGPPSYIGNTGNQPVTIAPKPLTDYIVENYQKDLNFKAWSQFTLPNGMVAMGRYNQTNYYLDKPNTEGAKISLVNTTFGDDVAASLQIVTKAGDNPGEKNKVFEGSTTQYNNVSSFWGGAYYSVLGQTATDIFNYEFGGKMRVRGVPLERYDFSGYGANVFSKWLNENGQVAQVSKAIFDVWRGRTAKEVIQVRSIIYPWGIRVVRTITMYRSSTGFDYRVDSGWRADSDGVYDFRTRINSNEFDVPVYSPDERTYEFHAGLVKGVYNVKNIVENDLAPYHTEWTKDYGVYINDNDGMLYKVSGELYKPDGTIDAAATKQPLTSQLTIDLIPVYFDADVLIADVEPAAKDTFVPAKKMLGYLQKAPRAVFISPEHFAALLTMQNGLGGPVDCSVNINGTGQKMRLSRVEVNPSYDVANGNKLVFVTAAKGMPVLPKDGSWSLVAHNKTSKEVTPVTEQSIALVRKGIFSLNPADEATNNNNFPKEITPATELFKAAEDRLTQYGFLQNTDTQKVLFRNPFFEQGKKLLQSTVPDLADAYRLLNSKGVFPKIEGLPKIEIDAQGAAIKIIEQGYQLVDKAATNMLKAIEHKIPAGPWYFVETDFLKVYAVYAPLPKVGSTTGDGKLNFDLNSQANKWVNNLNNITIAVDLLSFTRLFLIRGDMQTQKGVLPEFKTPKLIPGKDLDPIIEILEVLELIGSSPDYAALAKKGLQIAMSNSPNNWEYKFQADKEIPVLRFPAAYLDGPTTPLRLEANLKLGCYFNLAMPVPPTGLPAPSGGAFIEFGGKMEVMCVSLAAATIYAVGMVILRVAADSIKGPSFYLKAGFGVEIMVGLPVVGNVSVLYAVGMEISADSKDFTIAAFIMFRGRAELIGGLVTVTILIEAAGKIHKSADRTDCVAQVTFSIDISICFVIDIDFSTSWEESRQIA